MTQNPPERVWIQNDTKDQRALLAEYAEAPHPDVIDSFPQYVRADLHEALTTEVIALRQEVTECHANINIKADFIEATMNQLAASDEVIDALRKRVEAADALANICEGFSATDDSPLGRILATYRATVTP